MQICKCQRQHLKPFQQIHTPDCLRLEFVCLAVLALADFVSHLMHGKLGSMPSRGETQRRRTGISAILSGN